MTSSRHHCAKVLLTVGYSIVAIETDTWRHLSLIRAEHGLQCIPWSSRIISEMLSDVHKMEKRDFLN